MSESPQGRVVGPIDEPDGPLLPVSVRPPLPEAGGDGPGPERYPVAIALTRAPDPYELHALERIAGLSGLSFRADELVVADTTTHDVDITMETIARQLQEASAVAREDREKAREVLAHQAEVEGLAEEAME